ncbi:Hypothetical protein NTJ_00191 [Nesidiocoris tenuis]|uniref:Uncharacterized protein n=1 Tax=Nesidiocoris tenuis TaxID=355587 RepID=A0ABN7A8D5_9HEMI|nr:Hypothetical protein NTJ_00191 [Nesidiocoris tenuis]
MERKERRRGTVSERHGHVRSDGTPRIAGKRPGTRAYRSPASISGAASGSPLRHPSPISERSTFGKRQRVAYPSCETTLRQAWPLDGIPGPQCAFKLSMFMCPAVHTTTRSLLRLSSTHEPSDPPLRVIMFCFFQSLPLLAEREREEIARDPRGPRASSWRFVKPGQGLRIYGVGFFGRETAGVPPWRRGGALDLHRTVTQSGSSLLFVVIRKNFVS